MTLTAVSLFAGVEGFGLGLHRAEIRTVAAVETDDAARGVIADRMPDTALFEDVCEVTGDDLRGAGFVPERGIVTAGWPCTDLSVAGRRLGLAGARSGLFWQVVRILADVRPRWFVLENVPGLLSAVCPCPGRPDGVCGEACADGPHQMPGGACGPGRCMELHGGAMGAVVGALEGLGYGLAWRVLDAQHFGVPQRRRRVIFVGCLGDGAAPVEVLLEPEGCGGDSAPGGTAREGAPAVAALSASGGGADDNDTLIAFDAAQVTSPENRVNPKPGDPAMPLAATGQPHVAFALRADPGGAGQGHNTTYVYAVQGENSTAMTGGGDAAVARQVDVARSVDTTGGYATNQGGTVVAHALTAEGADASEDGTGRGTPLVPVAFDWQTDGSDRARPNISAERTSSLQTEKRDAVAVPVAWRGRGVEVGAEPVANALRSGGDGHTGDQMGYVLTTAVRRLTPVECERLQGFPDGWTATSWGKPQSDSARYRQLGNAVAVPVVAWVARRLVAADSQLRTGGSL